MAKYLPGRGDPYVDSATGILRNRVGATDRETLERIEATVVAGRTAALTTRPVRGAFDLEHLQRIHRRLFGDVYDWAGTLRTVGISKGTSMFARPEFIESEGANIFGRLAREQHLRGRDPDAFGARAAEYLGDVNALHPFREGNGRTQRAFFGQLAQQAGYHIGWEGVTREAMTAASIAVMHGDARPMTALIRAHLVERGPERGAARAPVTRGHAFPAPSARPGLVREPPSSYSASAPVVGTAAPARIAPRQPDPGQPEPGPAPRVRFVATRLEQYERALTAGCAATDARERQDSARVDGEDAQRAMRVATGAEAALTDALGNLYRDPGRARAAIDAAAAAAGIAGTSQTMRTAPERFGGMHAGDPGSVRASAELAADLALRAAAAREAAPIAERLVALVQAETRARAGVKQAEAARTLVPPAERLIQSAARGVARLDEREFTQLVRALPAHRAAMAVTLRDGIALARAVDGGPEGSAGRSAAARTAMHVHQAVQRLAPDELRAITGAGAEGRIVTGAQAVVRARVAAALEPRELG